MSPITPTHYEILGLPLRHRDEPALTPQKLRAAYRRALLRWHPDKVHTNGAALRSSYSADKTPSVIGKVEGFSVDQISTAYSVLSNRKQKGNYDKELKLLRSTTNGHDKIGENGLTGVDVLDLDDLVYDESENVWYRGCRCGEERGFLVREEDLEEGESHGEVVVGCKGCSIWMRVLFGVVEDWRGCADVQDADALNGKKGDTGT